MRSVDDVSSTGVVVFHYVLQSVDRTVVHIGSSQFNISNGRRPKFTFIGNHSRKLEQTLIVGRIVPADIVKAVVMKIDFCGNGSDMYARFGEIKTSVAMKTFSLFRKENLSPPNDGSFLVTECRNVSVV